MYEYKYFRTIFIDPYEVKDEEDDLILLKKLDELSSKGWDVIDVKRIIEAIDEVHYYKILAKRKKDVL